MSISNKKFPNERCPALVLDYPETYKPRFTMLVGIPGSGKSSWALSMKNERNVHISSDNIREELYGDASCQKDHDKVFNLMRERTLDCLKNGISVIYDATNISRKNRQSILEQLPKYVYKECVIVWAPINTCIERDSLRDRKVGIQVIDKMLRRFEAPFYDEGFDSIWVSVAGVDYYQQQYYQETMEALEIPHDNPHHSVGVLDHCLLCGKILSEIEDLPSVVKTAGFVHDIGKAYTKTFTNRKGETTEIAHYYDHQAVGAWISYGFARHSITLAWLISTHMAPFINQKYFNSLDPLYKHWIETLHEADKAAH